KVRPDDDVIELCDTMTQGGEQTLRLDGVSRLGWGRISRTIHGEAMYHKVTVCAGALRQIIGSACFAARASRENFHRAAGGLQCQGNLPQRSFCTAGEVGAETTGNHCDFAFCAFLCNLC